MLLEILNLLWKWVKFIIFSLSQYLFVKSTLEIIFTPKFSYLRSQFQQVYCLLFLNEGINEGMFSVSQTSLVLKFLILGFGLE